MTQQSVLMFLLYRQSKHVYRLNQKNEIHGSLHGTIQTLSRCSGVAEAVFMHDEREKDGTWNVEKGRAGSPLLFVSAIDARNSPPPLQEANFFGRLNPSLLFPKTHSLL